MPSASLDVVYNQIEEQRQAEKAQQDAGKGHGGCHLLLFVRSTIHDKF